MQKQTGRSESRGARRRLRRRTRRPKILDHQEFVRKKLGQGRLHQIGQGTRQPLRRRHVRQLPQNLNNKFTVNK